MCQFAIPFAGSASDLTQKAGNAITGAGGTFSGDENAGNFSLSTPVGKIAGSYTVEGNALQVKIEDKPFFVSCGQIEGQLKKSLGAA